MDKEYKTASAAAKHVYDFGHVEAKADDRYSREQILAMRSYQRYYNILLKVLERDKTYTLCEASRLIIGYMQREGIR